MKAVSPQQRNTEGNHASWHLIAMSHAISRGLFHYVTLALLILGIANTSVSMATEQRPQLAEALMISESISNKLTLADDNRLSNPQHFRALLLELAQQQSNFTKAHQHYFDYLTGYHFTYIGEHDDAEQKLTAIAKSNADVLLKFRANYTLINLSAINHKWADGLQYITDNNAIISNIHNEDIIQNHLLASTLFYIALKQYKVALGLITQLEQRQLSPPKECYLQLYKTRAKFYLGELNANSKELPTVIKLCVDADNRVGASSTRIYQARLYIASNQPEQALHLLLPYTDYVESTFLPMVIAATDNLIAKAYFQLGDMSNAKEFATKAMLLNKHQTGVQQARDSYEVLYQVAEKQKKYALSLSYFKQFAQLDKAFLDEVKTKHLAFQLAEHSSLEQASKIKLLHEKNNLLLTKQDLAEIKLHNIQLGIVVLTMVLVFLAIWGARLWRSHKRIKVLSECDELTGIYNRRHFNYIAVSALAYCKTAQQPLSLIMFDLDHFKKINDQFGHTCGDWALKETTRVCQSVGKPNDIFVRLGGEEFCLLLPSATIEEAYVRAEACRVAIESIITEESGFDFSISASFGITDISRSGFRLTELLKDADTAMYQAKRAGRNQVVTFEPENKGN